MSRGTRREDVAANASTEACEEQESYVVTWILCVLQEYWFHITSTFLICFSKCMCLVYLLVSESSLTFENNSRL